MPAGRCRCSPRRRAFSILYLRRYGRFDGGGGEIASVCPLADAIVRLTGVHFLFCISAGMIVSPVAAENLSSCARWPLPLFASPACIFHSVSPPAWSSCRWRRGICLRVPAGRCYCSPRRRAYFILYLRRPDRLDGGGVEIASVCPRAAAVLHLAGVHISFCISAGLIVLTVAARKLPPCARWPMLLFASPACIFHSVSPPSWSF